MNRLPKALLQGSPLAEKADFVSLAEWEEIPQDEQPSSYVHRLFWNRGELKSHEVASLFSHFHAGAKSPDTISTVMASPDMYIIADVEQLDAYIKELSELALKHQDEPLSLLCDEETYQKTQKEVAACLEQLPIQALCQRFGIGGQSSIILERETLTAFGQRLFDASEPETKHPTDWPPQATPEPLSSAGGTLGLQAGLILSTQLDIPHKGEKIEEIQWSFWDKAEQLYVMLCEKWMAPLLLGSFESRVAPLLYHWYAKYQAECSLCTLSRAEFYASKRPVNLDELQELMVQMLILAPDFYQDDEPILSALRCALGHHWDFWFD